MPPKSKDITPPSTASAHPIAEVNSPAGPPSSQCRCTEKKEPSGLAAKLKMAPFVVLGEGLAAGMSNFSLSQDMQQFSFPAQIARQMGVNLVQPLMEPPGIGSAIGFDSWAGIVPSPLQSTVLQQLPPDPISNLSVPGFTVSDAVHTRPRQPLIDRTSSQQTTVNLILGLSNIMNGATGPLPTQLELAVQCKPALAIVALGYSEALEAAIAGDPARLLKTTALKTDYSTVVRELRAAGATVIALTIPNPADTAYFSSIQSAASLVKLDPTILLELWGLRFDNLITANGLNEIAFQLNAASIGPEASDFKPLPANCILSAKAGDQLRTNIQALNQVIRQLAIDEDAIVVDLYELFEKVSNTGILVNAQNLTSEYLGGFYSLNGYFPGATGHAVIANEVLSCLNQEFGTHFPLVKLDAVLPLDPVAHYARAGGPNWSIQDLLSPKTLPVPSIVPAEAKTSGETTLATTAKTQQDQMFALQLPPGLEQVLPLNTECSYFGDAISAQHCLTPQTIQWSSGNNLLFGGLAMMDSHLSGNIRITFTPPVDGWTTFQISFEQGLSGTDGVLTAPTFYKLPGKQQFIGDVAGHISGGRLDLRTGEVDPTPGSLNIYANFFNSALFALIRVCRNFPTTPLSFPGQYGSASVEFAQRSDGKLDFTFQGSTFVPLGNNTRFPLNFCGPSREYASIPSDGTALHPRITITTKESKDSDAKAAPPIPFNTLQEFTLFTAASSFGDLFTLNTPEMGGPALGRSRLLGRVQIQFGPQAGNSVPIAVSTTTTGGMLAPLARTPIAQLFPGQLTPGPEGFYENLRFPLQTYPLNDLAVIEDPFDISVGALDIRTGELIHPLLHRGFINQDLIFALLRVEPRTPTSSFFFKGPGGLRLADDGELLFEFFGTVHIHYPKGFLFPDQNMATGFPVVDGGALDPYLWLWAIQHSDASATEALSESNELVSSRGETFSYRIEIPGDRSPEKIRFEFENKSQQGTFNMHSLAWMDAGKVTLGGESFNVYTLSCFGVWAKNGIERTVQAAAQLAVSPTISYTGIQIGPGGEISNVNAISPDTAFPVPLQVAAQAGLVALPSLPQKEPAGSPSSHGDVTKKPIIEESLQMFSHIIELTAKPGQAGQLIAAIRDHAIPEIITKSEGFVDQIVLVSATDPNQISAISFWQSKESGDAFFQNGFQKVSAITASFLGAKPVALEFSVGASTNDRIRPNEDQP
jgi:quinol monooxygenase YgiN